MATYDEELLSAARRLLARRSGQRGKLSSARIRRSISTSYFAIFHFLSEEVTKSVVGSHNDLRRRRRILARALDHSGMKTALGQMTESNVKGGAAEFFRSAGASVGPVPCPTFARNVASAFLDAQAKRHDADYDLNRLLTEADARLLQERVVRAIAGWRTARTAADKDFKSALCLLLLLRGKLRGER